VREQVATSAATSDDERRLKQILERRKTQSEAFFSSAAGQWDRLREELFGATSHLRALAGLLDPEDVIGDLGCGTGQVSRWLAPFSERVIAVDSSREMLRAAKDRLSGQRNVELRQGSLEKLPIDAGELDVALLLLVLHHVPEPQRALREAARALKHGGRLLILDMLPHEREEYRQTMGHVWLGISEKQMQQWLREAQFKTVRWQPLPPDSKTKGPGLFVATARRN
jgi:ArsR family transcriptional regulator